MTQSEFDQEGGANVLIHGWRDDDFEQRLRANFGGHQIIVIDNDTFSAMLKELRKVSFQLALITGISLGESDIEGQ
jgi:hypothetical protein